MNFNLSHFKKPRLMDIVKNNRDLERIFESFFYDLNNIHNSSMLDDSRSTLLPKVNISENSTSYNVEVEMPGIKEDDIEIVLDANVLTITGVVKESIDEKSKAYHLYERYHGSFQRSINLPNNIDTEKVRASYNNGLLKLVIDKKNISNAKKIKINNKIS